MSHFVTQYLRLTWHATLSIYPCAVVVSSAFALLNSRPLKDDLWFAPVFDSLGHFLEDPDRDAPLSLVASHMQKVCFYV